MSRQKATAIDEVNEMNAYLGKAFLIAILLAGFAGVYFKTTLGDRSFALGVWLVFSLVAGCWVLLLPVLRCPDCGRATAYFDNYSERQDSLTAVGIAATSSAKHCHSVIDRLDRTVVQRMTATDGKNVDRINSLFQSVAGASGRGDFVNRCLDCSWHHRSSHHSRRQGK